MVLVRQVLSRMLENNLYIKTEKCAFHETSVPLLDLIIQEGSGKADPEKIRPLVEWPVPECTGIADIIGSVRPADLCPR